METLTKTEVDFITESVSKEAQAASKSELEYSFWWWTDRQHRNAYRSVSALMAMAIICNEYSTR